MNETLFKAHSVLSRCVWGAALWGKCLSILAPWEESEHPGLPGDRAEGSGVPVVVLV